MIPKVETGRTTALPAPFLAWQCHERREVFGALARGEVPRRCPSHLPVVSTLNDSAAPFPIHSCNKGVGLMPRPALLADHVAAIEECLERVADVEPRRSLAARVAVALALYEHEERVDPGRLGAIEIFQGRTAQNLARDPRLTLLFTGDGPTYPSFQVNAVAEPVDRSDFRFRFIRGMRLLFERDGFHLQQPGYEQGYVLRVEEVYDKTPRVLGCPHARGGAGHGGGRRGE